MRNKTLEEVVGNLVLQGLLDEGQEDPMEFASQVIQEWQKYCLPKKKQESLGYGAKLWNQCLDYINQRDKEFMSKEEGK